MSKQKTTEEFIKQAKQVHGNKYDYSKTNYVDAKTKVCIICPKHGEFWQLPAHHINGHGCIECAGKKRLNNDDFIIRAKRIHGNKYDYSKIEYKNNSTKVCIICPKHGEFWQSPVSHINAKQGCPKCANNINFKNDEFIEKAKQIHGNKYDYSKTNYVNNHIKVCIICPKHGEFWQLPLNHLNHNQGCPKCRESKGENIIRWYLEKNGIVFETQKRFKECRFIRPLPFDFYLPDYNLCIEYQGEQHFFSWHKGLDTDKKLKLVQKRDLIKKEWCSKNDNPKLLEIKYTDDIIEILNENLKEI